MVSRKQYSLQIKKKLKYFTLFEVLVAMAIISICFIVMLNALGVNIRNTAISEGYTTACFLAKDKMVEILQRDNFEEGTEYGDFGEDYPNFEWEEEVEILDHYDDNKDAYYDDYDLDEEEKDSSDKEDNTDEKEEKKLFQVKLKISFKEANKVRSLRFETVVYEPEKNDI